MQTVSRIRLSRIPCLRTRQQVLSSPSRRTYLNIVFARKHNAYIIHYIKEEMFETSKLFFSTMIQPVKNNFAIDRWLCMKDCANIEITIEMLWET